MKNLFGEVNTKRIADMLYEMEVHMMRNTGAGSVSFKMYQYLIKGLQNENVKLAQEIESLEKTVENKDKEIEDLKNSLLTINPVNMDN